VFGNRVLRKIIGTKKDEATGEWRRLTNELLYDLYCSPGQKGNTGTIFMGKPKKNAT